MYDAEPLIGKIVIRDGKKMFVYNDIRAACSFFLRYRCNRELLEKDYSELSSRISNDDYEESLFRIAFDDIFRYELSKEDEEKIKKRLRELGYLE